MPAIHTLIQALRLGQEVYVLSPAEDGIEQLLALLEQRRAEGDAIAAIHLVAHGVPGRVYLGNGELNSANLELYRDRLKQVFQGQSEAPTLPTRLNLYSCEVAAGAEGKQFLAQLQTITGALVQASTTKIGHDSLGGNWHLDYGVGPTIVGALDSPFLPQVQTNYKAVLVGPGGVEANLATWLKADAGVTEDPGNPGSVATWADQSPNGNNATPADLTKTPELVSAVPELNGSAALRFNGVDDQLQFNRTIQNDFSVFAVFRTSQVPVGTANWYNGRALVDAEVLGFLDDFGLSVTNGQLTAGVGDSTATPPQDRSVQSANAVNDGTGQIGAFTRTQSTGVVNQYLNGEFQGTVTGSTNSLDDTPLLFLGEVQEAAGRSIFPDSNFGGDIAEVVVFSDDLSDADRNKVESYLGLKYGVALASGSDYVDSQGRVIWDGDGTFADYNNDVAGIGQDDASELNQTRARSGSSDAIVTVDNATDVTDGEFLLLGNDNDDNGVIETTTDGVPGGVGERLDRVWRVAETGEVGTVDLSFDLSQISVSGTQTSDFQLLIDSADNDFSNGARTISASGFANGIVTFTGVDLANGDFLSLATQEALNAAPSLSGDAALAAVAEDTLNPVGETVAALFSPLFQDANPGASLSGIAVVFNAANATTEGVWQYSTDNGANWSAIGAVTEATALALAATARIRFVPAANYNGTPGAIAVRALDDTFAGNFSSPGSRQTLDASTNGGQTAIAAVARSLTTNVTPVADDPSVANAIADQSASEGTPFQLVVPRNTFTDGDGDSSFVYSASLAGGAPLPAWLTFDPASRTFSGTPGASDAGNFTVQLTATDSTGATGSDSFTLAIADTLTEPTTPPVMTPPIIPNETSRISFSLASGQTQAVNEVIVIQIDNPQGVVNGITPGTEGYGNALIQQAEVLFSTFQQGRFAGQPLSLDRSLEVEDGNLLQFAVIEGGTLDTLRNGGPGALRLANVEGSGALIDASDLGANEALNLTVPLSGGETPIVLNAGVLSDASGPASEAPLGSGLQGGAESELLDFRGLTGTRTVTFDVFRDAKYDNVVGFYFIENEQGQVRNSAGELLSPGQEGYQEAALGNRLADIALTGTNGSVTTYTTEIAMGQLLAPFIVADGTIESLLDDTGANDPAVYFTHLGANSDGADHVRLFGDNTFGFEDLKGGGDRDFDDVVVSAKFS